MIGEIHAALRPGGTLLLAENLAASPMHARLRSRFGSGREHWRYFTIDELRQLHHDFHSFDYGTFGLLGLFGAREWQRSILGTIDRMLVRFVPERAHYAMMAIATKRESIQTLPAARD